jgi:ketosteroid isomerase-like protein
MNTPEEYEQIETSVETILNVWLEYDLTGDPSVFREADVFADDIIHNPPDNPPVHGREAVLEYLDSFDPTSSDWEFSIVDIEVGRDLVTVELSYRGRPRPDAEDVEGTSIEVFRREEDASLKHLISSPSPDGHYPVK